MRRDVLFKLVSHGKPTQKSFVQLLLFLTIVYYSLYLLLYQHSIVLVTYGKKEIVSNCFFFNLQGLQGLAMNRIRIHVLPSSRGRVSQPARPQEPQTCSFTQRPCSQLRLDGLEFCIKHILEDKNAPYKQCSYESTKNSKRCPSAAPKGEKKEGCVCYAIMSVGAAISQCCPS